MEISIAGDCTASEVAPNLWMGGAPPVGTAVGSTFEALVLSAMEYQPHPWCFPGAKVIRVKLNDDGSPMTRKEAFDAVSASKWVISRLQEDRRVLVTCMQGRNRSGLVTALALCYGPHQMSPGDAIRAVRAARGPQALSNPDFVKLIGSVCASRRGIGT